MKKHSNAEDKLFDLTVSQERFAASPLAVSPRFSKTTSVPLGKNAIPHLWDEDRLSDACKPGFVSREVEERRLSSVEGAEFRIHPELVELGESLKEKERSRSCQPILHGVPGVDSSLPIIDSYTQRMHWLNSPVIPLPGPMKPNEVFFSSSIRPMGQHGGSTRIYVPESGAGGKDKYPAATRHMREKGEGIEPGDLGADGIDKYSAVTQTGFNSTYDKRNETAVPNRTSTENPLGTDSAPLMNLSSTERGISKEKFECTPVEGKEEKEVAIELEVDDVDGSGNGGSIAGDLPEETGLEGEGGI